MKIFLVFFSALIVLQASAQEAEKPLLYSCNARQCSNIQMIGASSEEGPTLKLKLNFKDKLRIQVLFKGKYISFFDESASCDSLPKAISPYTANCLRSADPGVISQKVVCEDSNLQAQYSAATTREGYDDDFTEGNLSCSYSGAGNIKTNWHLTGCHPLVQAK